jgi:DNA-binding CsgD family transcriptional regulator
LSRRELEVASRAASRARTKEIAQALGLSESTVNNQLHSAFRKLGVSSRDELREVLAELGLSGVSEH